MAYEIPGQMVTGEAAADLSSNQWEFVALDANGRVAVASSGASAYGVLQNKPTALGQAATVMLNGISKVRVLAASTMSAGDLVAVSTGATGGAGIPAAGDYVVGRVVSGSSGSAGRIVSVNIEPVGTT